MVTLITIAHIIASFALVLIILLQAGKGASLSGLFGGGGGEAVFGGGGGDIFLKKVTTVLVVIFMLTSLTLAIISARSHIRTIVKEEPVTETSEKPESKESVPKIPPTPPPPPEKK